MFNTHLHTSGEGIIYTKFIYTNDITDILNKYNKTDKTNKSNKKNK